MRCQGCGTLYDALVAGADRRLCASCLERAVQAAVISSSPAEPASARKCPRCTMHIPQQARMCPYCRKDLSPRRRRGIDVERERAPVLFRVLWSLVKFALMLGLVGLSLALLGWLWTLILCVVASLFGALKRAERQRREANERLDRIERTIRRGS
jgi:Flp pilus assembly protein TadB